MQKNKSPLLQVPGIAIQGFEGSFHQMAAQKYFGKNVPVICCGTFGEVVKQAENNQSCCGAVMAIENSIAGSILPNYNLLGHSRLNIAGELYLQIRQQLLANPGVKLSDIHEVHSHPMALQQCLTFLDQYNWKLIESEDTALSAKLIHQKKNKRAAAIAGTLAAELFHLNILAADIHTMRNNYTRFLVLSRDKHYETPLNADKASINFQLKHAKGTLSKVLEKIANADINISKLQSVAIPGSNWKYSFHTDLEFKNTADFRKLIKVITPLTEQLKVYGIYKKGAIHK